MKAACVNLPRLPKSSGTGFRVQGVECSGFQVEGFGFRSIGCGVFNIKGASEPGGFKVS